MAGKPWKIYYFRVFNLLRIPKKYHHLPQKFELPHHFPDVQALLTLAEAAKILKISKTKLYHEGEAGRLNVVYIGVRCVRITEAEIRRYAVIRESIARGEIEVVKIGRRLRVPESSVTAMMQPFVLTASRNCSERRRKMQMT